MGAGVGEGSHSPTLTRPLVADQCFKQSLLVVSFSFAFTPPFSFSLSLLFSHPTVPATSPFFTPLLES